MRELSSNELYVIFNPEFLDYISDVERLGCSVTISKYYIEDFRATGVTDIKVIISDNEEEYYKHVYFGQAPNDDNRVIGLWDKNRKELKVHLALPDSLYSNLVETRSDAADPEEFEIEKVDESGINNGKNLIRILRYFYKVEDTYKTAFVLTGNIKTNSEGFYYIEPIRCNQSKNLLTIGFPDNIEANIKTAYIEKDTKFLEEFGLQVGINVFRYNEEDDEDLVSRDSFYKYLRTKTSETDILRKDTPYISNSGRNISSRYTFKVYTEIIVSCSGLIRNITPPTRPALNRLGGSLSIYGDAHYIEYEFLDNELKYVGEGSESVYGIPDASLIITEHDDGLKDVSVDGFTINYGSYGGQPDPSVYVKINIKYYNPFTNRVEELNSGNIKITQEENVISEWEVIYRSTNYTEYTDFGDIPVYMFPFEAGREHNFVIRTTLPDINIRRDFYMEYENEILSNLFDYTIERIPQRDYPIVDYRVTITSKRDNLSNINWEPIIDGVSTIKLATLHLNGYEYSESFYFVQSPKTNSLELHDIDDNPINSIVFANNQTSGTYFPIATEAETTEQIGIRNMWKVLEKDENVLVESEYGLLNPNNIDEEINSKLIINIPTTPTTIDTMSFGKLILGRVKESEINNSFSGSNWRDVVSLSKVSVSIDKLGIRDIMDLESYSLTMSDIELYSIKVYSNGQFACYMNGSEDYCFFDPDTNEYLENHYFSNRFDRNLGVNVYIALKNTVLRDQEPELIDKVKFIVTEQEPDWSDGEPEIFEADNVCICDLYIKAPNVSVDYYQEKDAFVFLGNRTYDSVRFKSTETPVYEITQISRIDNSTHRIELQDIVAVDEIATPVMTTNEKYMYHTQRLQNPNDIISYYPISLSGLYTASSTNYSDIYKQFYLFRKGYNPELNMIGNSGNGNTIYFQQSGTESEHEQRIRIEFYSRYLIRNGDLDIIYNDEYIPLNEQHPGAYTLTQNIITTSTRTYRYQYNLSIRPDLDYLFKARNEDGEYYMFGTDSPSHPVYQPGRLVRLGTIEVVSRIPISDFINVSSIPNAPTISYTQEEVDEIATPSSLLFTVYRSEGDEGSGGGGSQGDSNEISISGNRSFDASNNGETRSFNITTLEDVTINDIEINEKSVSGKYSFNLEIPSITYDYQPCIPSNSYEYITYSEPISTEFNINISGEKYNTDDDTSEIINYSEKILINQSGINYGLICATPNNSPRLYLGDNNYILNETVSPDTTSLDILLGVYSIKNKINEGTVGTTNGVNINSSSDNGYRILSVNSRYYNENWTGNVRLTFPKNTTSNTINRIFTITYLDKGLTHKLIINIEQTSEQGTIYCSNDAYFFSDGECLSDTVNDIGYFKFETDINIRELSLSISPGRDLLTTYNIIDLNQKGDHGGAFKKYKVYIKLKQNKGGRIISQILNFIKTDNKGGYDQHSQQNIVKSVNVYQGFYCLSLYYPDNSDNYVETEGTIGSLTNPIMVPANDNFGDGTTSRKLFRLRLTRAEPPNFGNIEEIELVQSQGNSQIQLASVNNSTWNFLDDPTSPVITPTYNNNPSISVIGSGEETRGSSSSSSSSESGTGLTSHNTVLVQTSSPINLRRILYLENQYIVNSNYINRNIYIKINVSIQVGYPSISITGLSGTDNESLEQHYNHLNGTNYKSTYNYTLYLLKRAGN